MSQIHSDYRERREIYQLYHVLNHALLFGGSYVQQADSLIAHL
ncbi:fructosamine kinase family protein [Thalassolituus marinus]|uniref:Fructosamine kinase family protein n=1 Tax=Thalassolituus marinus TaxID=671053 RepID=A0ABS7ZQI0_9GAMM|nr:fructosamine kinase family protein [Thalassolituus marinus]